jgi:hypothetical protein
MLETTEVCNEFASVNWAYFMLFHSLGAGGGAHFSRNAQKTI